MSMMQILGAFAKNLLDEDGKSRAGILSQSARILNNQAGSDEEEKSRTGIVKPSNRIPEHNEQTNSSKDNMHRRRYPIGQHVLVEDDEGNVRPITVLPRPSWTKDFHFQPYGNVGRKTIRNSDVARIANKVTRSVANHIDRMVKKRAMGTSATNALAVNSPLNYSNSPFHNINNPFWSTKRHSIAPTHKYSKKSSYCPSCLRRYSSKAKRADKSKKNDKDKDKEKSKEGKPSKKSDNNEKRKTIITTNLQGMQRPVVTTDSVNLVRKPKTVWAKELLQEFREQAVTDEQQVVSNTKEKANKEEPPKENRPEKVKKRAKPKSNKVKITVNK